MSVMTPSPSSSSSFVGQTYLPEPLHRIDISGTVGSEYIPLFEDIVRVLCIQLTVQLMLYFGGAERSLFTVELLCVSAYVVLGVMLYWLVFKHVASFT